MKITADDAKTFLQKNIDGAIELLQLYKKETMKLQAYQAIMFVPFIITVGMFKAIITFDDFWKIPVGIVSIWILAFFILKYKKKQDIEEIPNENSLDENQIESDVDIADSDKAEEELAKNIADDVEQVDNVDDVKDSTEK